MKEYILKKYKNLNNLEDANNIELDLDKIKKIEIINIYKKDIIKIVLDDNQTFLVEKKDYQNIKSYIDFNFFIQSFSKIIKKRLKESIIEQIELKVELTEIDIKRVTDFLLWILNDKDEMNKIFKNQEDFFITFKNIIIFFLFINNLLTDEQLKNEIQNLFDTIKNFLNYFTNILVEDNYGENTFYTYSLKTLETDFMIMTMVQIWILLEEKYIVLNKY